MRSAYSQTELYQAKDFNDLASMPGIPTIPAWPVTFKRGSEGS